MKIGPTYGRLVIMGHGRRLLATNRGANHYPNQHHHSDREQHIAAALTGQRPR